MTRRAWPTVDTAATRASRELAIRAMVDRGDHRAAIDALMEAHGETVFGFCSRVLRDRVLAEDVLQRVFLEAYRDLARVRDGSSLFAWLIGIAGHRCQDAVRAQRRRLHRIESNDDAVAGFADPAITPSARFEHARIVTALEDCLRGLSEEARIAVLLRFAHGKSYEEMAALLDTKANTLNVRVARALPVLKQCLEAKGWSDDAGR